ncbi:hypothetical protein ACFW6E_38025 [Streptomyces olivaceoviridis]|uniref:hypothetical protein n=1 Tax=Streptomyces olivaceoviridis TaxID=1921 RepID=UPI00167A0F41|nr:hypothetical protein [Streptomyces olivaceoviridis]GGZ22138.1 hypothetical protein GCM10010300_77340 [Streptomyces olivaceoviridis]
MVTIPLALLAGGGIWLCWRAEIRAGVLVAALLCGYALATSPLAGAINGIGSGIATAVQNAGDDQAASSSR